MTELAPSFNYGDAYIPGLADVGLDRVPGYRVDPMTGKEDEQWRVEYFDWAHATKLYRLDVQLRCRSDSAYRKKIKEICRNDPAFFVVMFLVVEEPRTDIELAEMDEWGYDMLKEFMLFAYQVNLIQLTARVLAEPRKRDIYISKARGIGVTYTMAALAWWSFLFRPWRLRFLSEKLEKVDRSMDLDSTFGKLDLFAEATPNWMMPEGFNVGNRKHRQQGMFKNPRSRAQLTGEATTGNSIRGGRATGVFNDEVAFQEQYRDTRATISGSCPHIIDWTSESYAKGRQWSTALAAAKESEKCAREEGREPVSYVIELEWYYNPYQDKRWYAEEFARYEAQGNASAFAVEYLRNPDEGYGTLIYPTARNLPRTSEWYDPERMLSVSVDPGLDDDCAWVFWQTHFPDGRKMIRLLDGYSRSKMPVHFYAHLITGIMPRPEDMAYQYTHILEQHKEQYFMRWLYEVPPHMVRYYGDPAVRARDMSMNSFQSVMNQYSMMLREREGMEPIPVHIMVPREIIHKRNNFHDRRNSAREALMHTEVSLTPGAGEVQEALYSVRLQEETEKNTRAPGTIHDRFSHYTQSWEFGMVYEELKLAVSEVEPIEDLAHVGRIAQTRTAGLPQVSNPYAQLNRTPVMSSTLGMG